MELPKAFALLQEAQRQIHREGGQPVAAAVKNRLLGMTDRTFSEAEFGLANFRAFLETAEANGIVALAPTVGGDVEVLLPGQPQTAGSPRRMRRDFWNAFIRWDDGKVRFYDRESDRVLNVDSVSADALTAVGAHKYVSIPAPPRAATAEAMRKFLEQVPGDARPELQEILQGTDNVEKKFVDALPPEARAAWRAMTAWQVLSRAERWRKANDLDVDLHTDPAVRFRPATSPAAPTVSSGVADYREEDLRDEAIRRRVVAAVKRMPLSAVLQLAIPVEYLLGDGTL